MTEVKLHQIDEPCNKYNRWNRLIDIKKNTKSKEDANKSELWLNALNTAGGLEIIGNEPDNFIMENKELWIVKKVL